MGRFTRSTTQHNIIMTAAAAPKAKAAAKPKVPAAHPPYASMIKAAIKALGDKKGSSRQAILKYICANYKVDAAKAGSRVRIALKKLVTSKAIVAAAAAGKKGAGSFKLPLRSPKPSQLRPKSQRPRKPRPQLSPRLRRPRLQQLNPKLRLQPRKLPRKLLLRRLQRNQQRRLHPRRSKSLALINQNAP